MLDRNKTTCGQHSLTTHNLESETTNEIRKQEKDKHTEITDNYLF